MKEEKEQKGWRKWKKRRRKRRSRRKCRIQGRRGREEPPFQTGTSMTKLETHSFSSNGSKVESIAKAVPACEWDWPFLCSSLSWTLTGNKRKKTPFTPPLLRVSARGLGQTQLQTRGTNSSTPFLTLRLFRRRKAACGNEVSVFLLFFTFLQRKIAPSNRTTAIFDSLQFMEMPFSEGLLLFCFVFKALILQEVSLNLILCG